MAYRVFASLLLGSFVTVASLSIGACTGTVRVERDRVPVPEGGSSTPPPDARPPQPDRNPIETAPGLVSGAEEAACAKYSRAFCERRVACGFGGGECNADRWPCVDQLFVADTTRTPENVAACADAIAENSCENVGDGVMPPCVSPGTRADGEACSSDNQCASHFCDRVEPCGRCATLAVTGGECDETTVCPVMSLCKDGRCVEIPRPQLEPGSACTPADDCAGGYCEVSVDGGASVCVALPREGQRCDSLCENGSRCSSGRCARLPGKGEPCLVDDALARGFCQDGLRCLDRTCVPPGKTGAPCEPQAVDAQCEWGECACAAEDCTRYTCHAPRFPGEPCGTPDTFCVQGAACRSGVCVTDRIGTPHRDGCENG